MTAEGGTAAWFGWLAGSERLARRRFEMLPLRGPGAVFTEVQGRIPADTTAPEALADLISSISHVGLLQPLLVEEIPDPPRPPRRLLVAGERRLRALRWGAVNEPDNRHFDTAPAVVCPGPLAEAERRIWQLVENLAREDLQPGELATAMLLERCAVLTAKLLHAGRPVPADVAGLDDPVARWRALEGIRGADPGCAAPWAEVIRRLGLQLSPRKARELVRAFAALPRELSEEMDEAKIMLHTRIRFARLHQGRAAAAEQIWSAVRRRRRPDLLPAAVSAGLECPQLDAAAALELAEDTHTAANLARGEKLRRPTPETPRPAATTGDDQEPAEVDPALVADAVRALRALTAQLLQGRRLGRYDTGSLRLLLDQARRAVSPDTVTAA